MKDEIKEILKILKKCEFGACITKHNSRVLLDYITNLQEENERLFKNQRYYKNGVFSLEYDKETMSDMIDDYKSRNKKAIECIKDFLCTEEYIKLDPEAIANNYRELLNILKSETPENLYKYTPEKGFRLVGDDND